MAQCPVIAIVGRPNVGKSSLLNALAGKMISIVQDMPGVTRDRVSTHIQIDGRFVELIDTGGYGFEDPDKLTEHIKEQIEHAMRQADVVLLIVDAQSGLTAGDQEVASLLRREGISAILIANKADSEKGDIALAEFARLGLSTPIGVSAMNGRNIENLIGLISSKVDLANAPTEMADPHMHLAIVGKRNAGKSTLVNAIAGIYQGDPNRVIVSEVPGTTRDSVDVRFEKDGKTLIVIDTAGVRKKRQMVSSDLEFYSFHRAQRSVRRADVVFMLIDGTEPISEPDRKLGQYIAEQSKPVILVVNKWDLATEKVRQQRQQIPRDDELMREYSEYMATELPWLSYAPVAFTTAKDGRNIQRILDMAVRLFAQARERITTAKLNDVVKQILTERTCPTPSGNRLKLYYATQVDVAPPTVVLFVNQPRYVTEDYERFVINRFRELLPFREVPIKLHFRGKGERGEEMTPNAPAKAKKPATSPATAAKKPTARPVHLHKPAAHPRSMAKQKHHGPASRSPRGARRPGR